MPTRAHEGDVVPGLAIVEMPFNRFTAIVGVAQLDDGAGPFISHENWCVKKAYL